VKAKSDPIFDSTTDGSQ
jgi:hypothetical protein